MDSTTKLGQAPIGKLLLTLGFPSAMGFLVVILYGLADTMMLGQWVNATAIAAVTVAEPITYLLAAVGMAIGVGGSSVISRAFGANEIEKSAKVLGNQVVLSLLTSAILLPLGWIYQTEILEIFGATGPLIEEARIYYTIVLVGLPFLSLNMIGHNVIIAEGKAKLAMVYLIVPTVTNVSLDIVFIYFFNWGIAGAAWATFTSFVVQSVLFGYYFIYGDSLVKLLKVNIKLRKDLVLEILSIGGSALANQVIINVLAIVLNYSLYTYKGELGIAIYGIIYRIYMLFLVPVIGVSSGFTPMVGYNYGAKLIDRVKAAIKLSIQYTTIISIVLLLLVILFSNTIVSWFTSDTYLLEETPRAMAIILALAPTLPLQFITIAYFQAIGKPKNAVILLVGKYVVLLIPALLILPEYMDWNGITYAFPIVDAIISVLALVLLKQAYKEFKTLATTEVVVK